MAASQACAATRPKSHALHYYILLLRTRLAARTLLVAPGIPTRNKRLLYIVAPGLDYIALLSFSDLFLADRSLMATVPCCAP